jgi:hypothetical protein
MSETTIPLSRRYEAHGKTFTDVTLRAPKLRDHFAVGDPVEVHPGPDGTGRFILEHGERIEAYLDRLAVADRPGRECLDDLDLADSIRVREAITGFFSAARLRNRPPTNSSSGPGKTSDGSAT